MKNKPKKAKTQKHKKIIASIPGALLFAYLAVFISGCSESLQPGLGGSGATETDRFQLDAFRVIQRALSDDDPLAKVNAVEVIVTTKQIRFMSQVHRLLRDEFAPVRFAAALAVGDLQYSIARGSVSRLLKDEDLSVIVAAAYAMGRIGYPEYLEVVRKAMESEDQTVRANAAFMLGRTGDQSLLGLLKQAQEDKNSSDKVRFQVLEARARLGDEELSLRKISLSAWKSRPANGPMCWQPWQSVKFAHPL
jgi:HEAT repeat protein